MKKLNFKFLMIKVSLFLFVLFVISPLAFAIGFHWVPLSVELTTTPGERKVSFSAYIENQTQDEKHFQLAIADVKQRKDGHYEFLPPGSSKYSCAGWIKVVGIRSIFIEGSRGRKIPLKPLKDMRFSVLPGGWREILCEISIPREAEGGYYAALLCRSYIPRESEEQVPEELKNKEETPEERAMKVMSQISTEVSTIVLLTVKKWKKPFKNEAELQGEVLPTQDGKGIKIIGSLTNKGKNHIFGKGKLKVKRKGGRWMEYPLGSGRGGVLRGSTIDFASMFKEAPPGEYEAELILYYGARRPLRIKIPFSIEKKGVEGKAAKTVDFDVPDLIEKKVVPGGRRILTIPVMNYENDTIHIKARPIAFRYDEYGEIILEKESLLSCLSLTTLGPLNRESGKCEFDIRPGRWRRVRVEIDFSNISKEASGGRYVGVEFEGTKKGEEGITTLTSCVLLTLTGRKNQKKGEITNMKVFMAEGTELFNFVVALKNTGNIHFTPKGKVIIDRQNKEGEYKNIGETEFEELSFPILPGDTRFLTATYPEKLEPGKYMLNVIIEGTDEPIKLQQELVFKYQ